MGVKRKAPGGKRTDLPMTADEQETRELEGFIQEWYYGETMHRFAIALGKYLFQFIDYLRAQELSEKTMRKHIDNCWCIGYLESNLGYRDEFVPGDVFCCPEAGYEYEFERKMSHSRYALESYRTTWRKLHSYTKALGHLDGAEGNPCE